MTPWLVTCDLIIRRPDGIYRTTVEAQFGIWGISPTVWWGLKFVKHLQTTEQDWWFSDGLAQRDCAISQSRRKS